MSLDQVLRVLSFFASLFVFIVGVIHVTNLFGTFCNNSCVGPMLNWSTGNFIANTNTLWRLVFSLAPSLFLVNWIPVICGTASTLNHLNGFDLPFISSTWLRVCIWNLFLALLCSFGYAGNMGVLVGFLCSLVSFLAVILHLMHRAERTTLDISIGFLNCGNSTSESLIAALGRITSFANAILIIVVGFIHVFVNTLGQWCNTNIETCVGPLLVWSTNNFIADVNGAPGNWRSFFTLDPNILAPIWGPLFFGVISFSVHFIDWGIYPEIASSWSRVCLWHLFLAFFCSFGYAGNLGILTGFLCVFTSLCAFVIILTGGAGPTVLTLRPPRS